MSNEEHQAAPGSAASTDGGEPFDEFAVLFDRFAGLWDRLDGRFPSWVRSALSMVAARPGGRAVDLGCGAGRHSVLLADHVADVLAVDASAGMLGIARRDRSRPGVRYEHRNARTVTPASDGVFDVVLSVHTLHHLFGGEPRVVLEWVRSLVAPGGIAVLADIVDPGGWADRRFHEDRAFTDARAAYGVAGHRQAALTVLDLLLHPRWLQMTGEVTPLTRERFTRVYEEVFPGAVFAEGLPPLMAGVVWRDPRSARQG